MLIVSVTSRHYYSVLNATGAPDPSGMTSSVTTSVRNIGPSANSAL